jgi:2-dehydro-3-deoxy-D-arabinonate dehydratase
VYRSSAALANRIRPAWEVPDPYALEMALVIERAGAEVFAGSESIGRLHRRLDELVGWCRSALEFPDGFVLSTGTSLVPELPFTLEPGDVVRIAIGGIGELANPVVAVGRTGR